METYQFQITDILSDDTPVNINKPRDKSFVITIYGIDEDSNRIVCHVRNYYPYFYLKVPNDPIDWSSSKCKRFLKDISSNNNTIKDIKSVQSTFSHDFYGFHWDSSNKQIKKYQFYKISFTTFSSMKKLIQDIKDYYNEESNREGDYKDWFEVDSVSKKNNKTCDCNIYESFIHPIIRFIHESDIEPTGWIECDCNNKYRTDLFNIKEISCDWNKKNIRKIENKVSDYIIAAYDIECDSSHGDFPLAKKSFKKLATDVFDSLSTIYQKTPSSKKSKIVENITSYLENLIILGFEDLDDLDGMTKIYATVNRLIIKDNILPEDSTIELIIHEILHDTNIIELIQKIKSTNKDRDGIINAITKIMDKIFKKENIFVKGDPIIQIGTVFHKYGEKEPYIRHILVIGPEDNMDDKDKKKQNFNRESENHLGDGLSTAWRHDGSKCALFCFFVGLCRFLEVFGGPGGAGEVPGSPGEGPGGPGGGGDALGLR